MKGEGLVYALGYLSTGQANIRGFVLGKCLGRVVLGDVLGNVREECRFRPGMAQEKSGHPNIKSEKAT